MNMWHDTEIEPTSAGVSHSAPAEVEVTLPTFRRHLKTIFYFYKAQENNLSQCAVVKQPRQTGVISVCA